MFAELNLNLEKLINDYVEIVKIKKGIMSNMKFTYHAIFRLVERLPWRTEKEIIQDIVKCQSSYMIRGKVKEIYGKLARYIVDKKWVIITLYPNQ